ncbi:MAG: ComEC/Rec2 family competence protein [Pseudobdellovibrionaceae bacterium]
MCLNILPDTSAKSISAALLCGENLEPSRFKQNILQLSLIHIFVVSGSHLIFLNWLLKKLHAPSILRICILFCYCGCCQFQAPVTRSFIQLILSQRRTAWLLTPESIILASGSLCLLLERSWLNSLSLALSWATSLSLVISRTLSSSTTNFLGQLGQQTGVALCLLGLLKPWSYLHPLALLSNIFLAFPMSLALLITSLLSILNSFFIPWHEKLFIFFSEILNQLTTLLPQIVLTNKMQIPIQMWFWLIFLHLFIFLYRLQRRRYQIKVQQSDKGFTNE